MKQNEHFYTLIEDVADYPKPGVMFKDISPLLGSKHFPEVIGAMAGLVQGLGFEAVAGIEARGFILGSAMAQHLGVGFVPVRKKGKLPPPVISHSYSLEYGEDTIEVKSGSGRVLIVDDVLATGGTLTAAAEALAKAGYDIAGFGVLMNLTFLNQFSWRTLKPHALLNY